MGVKNLIPYAGAKKIPRRRSRRGYNKRTLAFEDMLLNEMAGIQRKISDLELRKVALQYRLTQLKEEKREESTT